MSRQWHQISHGCQLARAIPLVRQDTPGLVKCHIHIIAPHLDWPSIHGDGVTGEVGPLPQPCHLPIDQHASLANWPLTGAARAKASTGENLLQSVLHCTFSCLRHYSAPAWRLQWGALRPPIAQHSTGHRVENHVLRWCCLEAGLMI